MIEVNPHGAFLDWGLEKDLLVPFREQPKELEEGRYALVFLYIDDATQRLAATARVQEFYESAFGVIEKEEEVDLLICESTDLGNKVIANHRYKGLIFHSDINRKIITGQRMKGYVKNVREDGKLDIVLHPEGYKKVEPLADELIQLIVQNGGTLSLNDKSDPDEIRRVTKMSKKTFKQVVGNLYKQRLIDVTPEGITLVQEEMN